MKEKDKRVHCQRLGQRDSLSVAIHVPERPHVGCWDRAGVRTVDLPASESEMIHLFARLEKDYSPPSLSKVAGIHANTL